MFFFYFLKTLFSGCPAGFCGSNCLTSCLYPYYGEQCKYHCNCTEELCDHVIGCTEHQGLVCFVIFYTMLFVNILNVFYVEMIINKRNTTCKSNSQ